MSGCGIAQNPDVNVMPELSDEKFVEYCENKVKSTILEYDLLKKDDKIAVAVSGGKDSTAVLHMLLKFGYDVEAVTVDAKIGCYTETNLENIRKYCGENGVKLHEISFRDEFGSSLCYLQSVLKSKDINLKSCTTCGVLRRTLLNKKVREIGSDILVTGHNLDDEAQGFVMNVLKNRLKLSARAGPKTGITQIKGLVGRVKPMYFLSNAMIIRYSKINKFPVHFGECPCSTEGHRSYIKGWLNKLEEKTPEIKSNIISYFLERQNKLREQVEETVAVACTKCGEPSSGDTCKSCQILDLFSQEANA